jgi:hypothetical protein
VQDVLAQITAILNILLKVIGMVFHPIYDRMMCENLINCIFYIKKDDKVSDEKLSNKKFHDMSLIKHGEQDKSNITPNELNKVLEKSKEIEISINKIQNKSDLLERITFKNFTIKEGKSQNYNPDDLFREAHSNFYLSFKEHFALIFCKCCGKQNQTIGLLFSNLQNIASNYTDIVSIAKTKKELEKLIYVLFDKEQVALFNLIPLPENPFKEKFNERISQAYTFYLDKEHQQSKARQFFRKNQLKRSHLDEKILKYLETNLSNDKE